MYYERAIFHRDIKTKNGKQKTQIRVSGLSVKSQFKDKENIIILSQNDFENLQNKVTTPTVGGNSWKYQTELMELKDTINLRNELLFNLQDNVYNMLDLLTENIINSYTLALKEKDIQNKEHFDLLLEQYKTELFLILYEYLTQVNQNIDNSNFLTRAFNKDKLKLSVDIEEQLKDKIGGVLDTPKLPPFEGVQIDINKIKNEVKNQNNLDLKGLFISTRQDKEKEI